MKRPFSILAIAVAVLGTAAISCSRSDNNNETGYTFNDRYNRDKS